MKTSKYTGWVVRQSESPESQDRFTEPLWAIFDAEGKPKTTFVPQRHVQQLDAMLEDWRSRERGEWAEAEREEEASKKRQPTLHELACLICGKPESGLEWLDAMIRESKNEPPR
jgi:hypothetical protein